MTEQKATLPKSRGPTDDQIAKFKELSARDLKCATEDVPSEFIAAFMATPIEIVPIMLDMWEKEAPPTDREIIDGVLDFLNQQGIEPSEEVHEVLERIAKVEEEA